MPRLLPALLLLFAAACATPRPATEPAGPAAATTTQRPEDRLTQAELAAHLRFLASDELMGRKAGTPGNDAAARYIAERFRALGLPPAPGTDDYLQRIPFLRIDPPAEAHLEAFGQTFQQGRQMVLLAGEAPTAAEGPLLYVGYGLDAADYAQAPEGSYIAVALAGRPDNPSPQAAFQSTGAKRGLAAEQGATALVELYNAAFPWRNLVAFLGGSRFGLDDGAGPSADLPHAWLDNAGDVLTAPAQQPGQQGTLRSSGLRRETVYSSNVAALLPGSDPTLRDEYVVLTAHFDHVGAGMRNGAGATPADSIFNGARDNAMGTTAVLGAAQALSQQPPRRSVLFLALTAEEDGLLGSQYYVSHPLVPLAQTVYTLNIDGAGYSDTTIVTVIGLGRTGADPLLQQAAGAYGLSAIADPAPEQNLFDRSDNVSFARKGVPAPTFSPGFRSFSDPGVANFYHRPTDEADDTFDFGYLHRFVQAYTYAARLIANADEAPFWVPGDPYEAAGKSLYGR